jgi:hypothetical protein
LQVLLILCALAIVLIAGALLFVERRIRARTRLVLDAAPRADRDAERIIELRMRHLGTGFADEMPLPVELQGRGEVDVYCTAEAVFVGGLAIPFSSVDDAAIERGALRLRFSRGGERLETALEAPMHDLERLRREVHLRQPNVLEKLVAMVQK